jgi:hypothetical protein
VDRGVMNRLRANGVRYLILLLLSASLGCGLNVGRRGLPAEVTATIDTVTADIDAERYEKIYREADDLFRQDAPLDQSTAVFKTMRTKLGAVKNRTLHSAVEQQNSGGELKGHVFILTYQTSFENGKGMENFTLVERNHQWLLARYRVSSSEFQE